MRKTTQLRTLFALGLILPAAVLLALFVVRAYAHDPGGADQPEGAAAVASTEEPVEMQPGVPGGEAVTRGEAEGIPLRITHQGVIKVSGRRFTGDGYFRFALVDADTNDNVWTTGEITVPVQEGVYRVALGDPAEGMAPIPTSVFTDHWNLLLRIWFNDGPHGEHQLFPDLKVTSTGYAYQAYTAMVGDAVTLNGRTAEQLVPIGTVLDWWRPDATFPLPDGFQICNGSTVTDPASPLNGQVLPNLTEKFVRGVTNPAYIGQTGGSSTHTHGIPYATYTSTAGDHAHTWCYAVGSGDNDRWYTWIGGVSSYFMRVGRFDTDSPDQVTFVPVVADNTYLDTNVSGSHNHSISVGPTYSADHIPPYVGLLKIMRIK